MKPAASAAAASPQELAVQKTLDAIRSKSFDSKPLLDAPKPELRLESILGKKEETREPLPSLEASSEEPSPKPTPAIQKVIELFEKHKRQASQNKQGEGEKKPVAALEVKKAEPAAEKKSQALAPAPAATPKASAAGPSSKPSAPSVEPKPSTA